MQAVAGSRKLYRAILQIRQDHPDANHNLGCCWRRRSSLPPDCPIWSALASNPEEEGYWLSYIDALILCGQTDVARQVLALGRQHGLQGEAVEACLRDWQMKNRKRNRQSGNAKPIKPAKHPKIACSSECGTQCPRSQRAGGSI